MSTETKRIILESQNDKDLSQEDLDDLIRLIREELTAMGEDDLAVVAVAHEPVGVGNQWSDVLNVFIPTKDVLADVVWTMVLDRVKSAMLSRFSREHEERRPRVIVVRSAETGEVERVLQAKGPDGEFIELEVEVVDSRQPPPLRLNPPE